MLYKQAPPKKNHWFPRMNFGRIMPWIVIRTLKRGVDTVYVSPEK